MQYTCSPSLQSSSTFYLSTYFSSCCLVKHGTCLTLPYGWEKWDTGNKWWDQRCMLQQRMKWRRNPQCHRLEVTLVCCAVGRGSLRLSTAYKALSYGLCPSSLLRRAVIPVYAFWLHYSISNIPELTVTPMLLKWLSAYPSARHCITSLATKVACYLPFQQL